MTIETSLSDSEAQQQAFNAFSDIKQSAKKHSPAYRRLMNNRYRNPAGFPTWESVACTIAAFDRLMYDMPPSERDWTIRASAAICRTLIQDRAPCYWLSKPLAEALMATDLPPVADLRKVVPVGVLILPTGLLRNPDGYSVDWVGMLQLDHHEYVAEFQQMYGRLPPGGSRVALTHVLPSSAAYSQNVAIFPDDDKPRRGDFHDDTEGRAVVDEERRFTHNLSDLLLKCLLVMQSRPELIEMAQAQADVLPTTGRRGKGKNAGEILLTPNWIGKDYQPRRAPQGGTHASPTTHWRRGHLKRVAIGEGRRDRKWVWIEPTLVN